MSSEPDNKAAPLDSNMNCDTNESGGISIPTEALCPYIDNDEIVKNMLKNNYGLTALQLDPLNGYDDRNYHVFVDPNYSNPNIDCVSSNGYFLKISSLQDSQRPELLYAQLAVMEHLLSKGVVVQTSIKGVNGEVLTKCTAANKDGVDVTYMVSLRSFLPGQIVASVPMTRPLLYNMGRYVGQVVRALEDFHHPYYDNFDCLWSMNNIPKVAEVTFAVKDDKMRSLSEEVLQAFVKEVVPRKSGFRTGQIHGDLNEQNILVTKDASPSSTPEICGLLDFQDSAHSYTIYDFAINVCYMLMTKYLEVPVTETPGHLLAGYTSILELTPTEKELFRTCVAARMVQSLVYGAYTYYMDPSNEYVLETSKCGWKSLETFWKADKDKMQQTWDDIIKSYK